MTKRSLYILTGIACLVGYIWLFVQLLHPQHTATICLWKLTTGIPCPACGTSRSMVELLHGHIEAALTTNPNGVLMALALLVVPIWLGWDLICRKDSFYRFFQQAERILHRKAAWMVLACLVITNWIWNILKGL